MFLLDLNCFKQLPKVSMVVFDPAAASCESYEIKHITEIVLKQAPPSDRPEKVRHDRAPLWTDHKKILLYRGATQDVDVIRYVNVEEYLKRVG